MTFGGKEDLAFQYSIVRCSPRKFLMVLSCVCSCNGSRSSVQRTNPFVGAGKCHHRFLIAVPLLHLVPRAQFSIVHALSREAPIWLESSAALLIFQRELESRVPLENRIGAGFGGFRWIRVVVRASEPEGLGPPNPALHLTTAASKPHTSTASKVASVPN